jgi:hypothetical protein
MNNCVLAEMRENGAKVKETLACASYTFLNKKFNIESHLVLRIVGIEGIKVVLVKFQVFWNAEPCFWVQSSRTFEGPLFLQTEGEAYHSSWTS